MEDEKHIEEARRRVKARARERLARHEALRLQAAEDARTITGAIARAYDPVRIYQWGSVLRPGAFRDYSDVDIAVEGVTDAETFFRMLGDVQSLSEFPVDLVQIEKIAPEHADDIRTHGRIVYERQ